MKLVDVNVLVYAHRSDVDDHARYAAWLTNLVSGPSRFAVSDEVLAGFVRVVTNRRVFPVPTPLDVALRFCQTLRGRPLATRVVPGPGHWPLFERLCREVGATGKLVPDAWFAALAIEHGCEWVTCDGDFARFPGLSCHHPLAR